MTRSYTIAEPDRQTLPLHIKILKAQIWIPKRELYFKMWLVCAQLLRQFVNSDGDCDL